MLSQISQFLISDAKEESSSKKRKAEEKQTFMAKKQKVDKKAINQERNLLSDLRADLSELSAADLKELLRLNGMKCTGKKTELVARAADGKAFGALPRCPMCALGYLRVDSEPGLGGGGLFTCPGAFDDDKFVACSFSAYAVDRVPWREAKQE